MEQVTGHVEIAVFCKQPRPLRDFLSMVRLSVKELTHMSDYTGPQSR